MLQQMDPLHLHFLSLASCLLKQPALCSPGVNDFFTVPGKSWESINAMVWHAYSMGTFKG